MKSVKPTGRAMTMPGGLALGAAVSLGITLLGCLMLSKLVEKGVIHLDNIGYGILILLLSGSFLGAITAKSKIKRRKMLVCMLSGLVYFLILICITALFFGGQYQGVWVTGLVVSGGAGTACLASAGKSVHRHKHAKPSRTRTI